MDGPRYEQSELIQAIDENAPACELTSPPSNAPANAPSNAPTISAPASVPTDNAAGPAGKLTLLLENSDDFRTAWRREQGGVTDRSPSGYDLSLCNYALLADPTLTDSDLVALMRAHRARHGDDPKRGNEQYYWRTAAKARTDRDSGYAPPPQKSGGAIQAFLKTCLLVERVEEYFDDDGSSTFAITLSGDGRTETVGFSSEELFSATRMERALFERMRPIEGKIFDKPDKTELAQFRAALAQAAVPIRHNTDAEMIETYLRKASHVSAEDEDRRSTNIDHQLDAQMPLVLHRNGEAYIRSQQLAMWARENWEVRRTAAEWGNALRKHGWRRKGVRTSPHRTVSMWAAPDKSARLATELWQRGRPARRR
jgi:hypothetical protein